jgi:hypothetical protein
MDVNWIVARARHRQLVAEAEHSRLIAQWQVSQQGQRQAEGSRLRLRWVIATLKSAVNENVAGRLQPGQAAG